MADTNELIAQMKERAEQIRRKKSAATSASQENYLDGVLTGIDACLLMVEAATPPTDAALADHATAVAQMMETAKQNAFVVRALRDCAAALRARPQAVAEGYAVLKITDLEELTFSFNGRERLRAMIAASQSTTGGAGYVAV